MQVGRELDALIAEKVMHFPWPGNGQCSCGGYCPKHGTFPHYSTDIAAAWEVVERMKQEGHITIDIFMSEKDGYRVNWFGYPQVDAHTLPEGICLAALKAAEGQEKR